MKGQELKLLGAELKRLRLNHGPTLTELGNRLGVTHKSVQFWEQGINEIKLSTLIKLCKIYEVSVDDILNNAGL